MADQLNPKIMEALVKKTHKAAKNIRPRLSEIRREHSGLTMNAAAQRYAEAHGTSVMTWLDKEDRKSLATVQAFRQVNVSSISKVDKRTLNITNSPIHNLSFGDRNHISQTAVALDNALVELSNKIEASRNLSKNKKNDYKSDIQTIASQIGKTVPNTKIIRAAWESIKTLAEIEGFIQLTDRVGELIKQFL